MSQYPSNFRPMPSYDDKSTQTESRLKGKGWLGLKKNRNGDDVSEYSIGVDIDGKQIDIPTLVPTLTKDEISAVLRNSEQENPAVLPQPIVQKAIDHAKPLIMQGKSPFKEQQANAMDRLNALSEMLYGNRQLQKPVSSSLLTGSAP